MDIQATIATTVPTTTGEPVRRPDALPAEQNPVLPKDSVTTTTPKGAAPATMALAGDPNPVDFTKVFDGFAVGGEIKISCSIPLAGGKGQLKSLSQDAIHLAGHVSIAGLVNQDLDVDLHKEADGTYRMTGTCNLHASISQKGGSVTITDLDSPTHHVFMSATRGGLIDIKTTGMGFDKIGAHVKAK